LNYIKTVQNCLKSSLSCKIFPKIFATLLNMDEVTVVTEKERQAKELAMLLGNERNAKNAARSITLKSLYYPMDRPNPRYTFNKNGDQIQTEESIKQQEAWDRCKARCKPDQNPTMWDVMNEGQAFEAITNSNSFVVVRDTAGLKPIDESKMILQPENPFANMSMEQLELARKIETLSPDKVQELLGKIDD